MLTPVARPAALWCDEEGSTATEYALIAALLALFAIAGLMAFTDSMNNMYQFVTTTVLGAIGA